MELRQIAAQAKMEFQASPLLDAVDHTNHAIDRYNTLIKDLEKAAKDLRREYRNLNSQIDHFNKSVALENARESNGKSKAMLLQAMKQSVRSMMGVIDSHRVEDMIEAANLSKAGVRRISTDTVGIISPDNQTPEN